MTFNLKRFARIAFLVVAIAFLFYNIYQAIVTSMIVSHFPLMIERLPSVIQSTNPSLQLALFVSQEVVASIGTYVRLAGAIFAVSFAVLFWRGKLSYLNMLSKALLFEAIYFLLNIPVVINHLVGSVISTSSFLNFDTGLSYLLQIVLVFPALFLLSRKIKNTLNVATFSWVILAVSLYFFGLWIKHAFMWIYGVLPMQTQPSLLDNVGAINSLFTLLLAAITGSITYFMIRTHRGTARMRIRLASSAVVIAGAYFLIYDVISIFSPIYLAYLLLTDAWMITFLVLGVALFYDNRNQAIAS